MKISVKHIKVLFLLLATVLFLFDSSSSIQAQQENNTSYGVATSIQINNKNVTEGDIISATTKGYILSSTEYDTSMFGVVTKNPAFALEDTNNSSLNYIVTSGNSTVRVSSINGPIKKDDIITSSSVPGVGMKATRNGFVLGNALENYSSKDTKKIGTILISINPHFSNAGPNATKANLIDTLKNAGTAMSISPVEALRYVVAGIIAVLAFVLGFLFFGKISVKGVEALGRNPLASHSIQLAVVMNVALTVLIIGVGLGIAYLILMF